jgi:hypothetical protein
VRPAVREAASAAIEVRKYASATSSDPELQGYFDEARQLLQETEEAYAAKMKGFQGNAAVNADYSALEKIRISQPLSYLLTIDNVQRMKLLDYILRVETFLYTN